MATTKRRLLEQQREYTGQKPGEALANWLNDPPMPAKNARWLNALPLAAKNYLEELLTDAQAVFRTVATYKNFHELMIAHKDGKLESGFWKIHQRLNEKLARFIHAPHIDLHQFYDGDRVSWSLATDESPMAFLAVQVRWVLQLIDQGAIQNIRRCQQCTKWYFARFSHQEFCSNSCRGKHFAKTDDFKQKRRDYMRGYYRRKKSENFK